MLLYPIAIFYFFFTATATTEIYTLSLHDALPIWRFAVIEAGDAPAAAGPDQRRQRERALHCAPGKLTAASGVSMQDRKSTRLNSSHQIISYAVFCLKKKKRKKNNTNTPPNYSIKP